MMEICDAKILIVDDDVLIAETLSDHLRRLGCRQIRMKHSAADAARLLSEWMPDLAMLDIYMEHSRAGLELGELLANTFHIPFMYITAHADEEITQLILKTKPKGYITKPIRENELIINLGMVLNDVVQKVENIVEFTDGSDVVKLNLLSIYFFKANGNYWEVRTKSGTQLLRTTLQELLSKLPESEFVRTHRSYIVHKMYITNSKYNKIKVGDTYVPVSRTYAKQLLEVE